MNRIDLVFAHVGEALDDFKGESLELDVKALADIFAEQPEVSARLTRRERWSYGPLIDRFGSGEEFVLP